MEEPFAPTWLNRFRNRRRLVVGRDCTIAPSATFSINRNSHIRFGNRVEINHGAILATYGGWIELGDRVSVNPYTILYGHGGLRIGDDVRIAAHCVLIPANHKFERRDVPIHRQGQRKQGIEIGNDVWIGAHSVILDGSVVGEGCVIAAGSVVRGRLDPFSVYGGAPARKLRERRRSEDALE